jgi:hypothetical protein
MTVEISVQIVLKEEGTTGKVKVKDGVRGYGLVCYYTAWVIKWGLSSHFLKIGAFIASNFEFCTGASNLSNKMSSHLPDLRLPSWPWIFRDFCHL